MAKLSLTTFVQAVILKARRDGTTPAAVADGILSGNFASAVVNGRTVIRTSEAGGSTEFALPAGLTPPELIELAGHGLRWIESQPDPANPGLPRQAKRLRVCFDRARL